MKDYNKKAIDKAFQHSKKLRKVEKKMIRDFHEKYDYLNSFNRVIFCLNYITIILLDENSSVNNIINLTKPFSDHFSKNHSLKNSKPTEDLNNPFTKFTFEQIDCIQIEAVSLKISIENIIQSALCDSMNEIFRIYGLDHSFEIPIKNGLPIISNNDNLMMISPLMYSLDEWKKIIAHELTILKDLPTIWTFCRKLDSLMEKLAKEIGNDRIFDPKLFFLNDNNDPVFNQRIREFILPYSFHGNSDFMSSFDIPLKTYRDSLKELYDFEIISRDKIIISRYGSQQILIKGIKEFFESLSRKGLKIPENINEGLFDFIQTITSEEGKKINCSKPYFSFSFLKGKDLKKIREDFIKIFILLSYSSYFASNKEKVISVLSSYLNKDGDLGFSESTLDRITLKTCFIFSDETVESSSTIRYNLLYTVLHSSKETVNQYKNSKAYKAIKEHNALLKSKS